MTLNNVTISKSNTGGLRTEWIEGYSRAIVHFAATDVTLEPGEEIAWFDVVHLGRTIRANALGNAVTGGLTAGTNTFLCSVHGTQGEISSLTMTVSAYAYIPPTATYEVIRCNSAGAADENGGYLKVTATVNHSPCGGANVATTTVRWKLKSAASWTDAGRITNSSFLIFGGGTAAADKTYELKLSLADTVGNTAEYEKTVASNYWSMKFSADGHGVSFGKNTATSGNLELASGMKLKMGNTTLTEAQLQALLNLI